MPFVDEKITLSLATSGTTAQVKVQGRTTIQIVVDTGDAAGTFYVRSAARAGLTGVAHPVLNALKTTAQSLNAKLDWADACGSEVLEVDYVRTGGGAGQSATIYVRSA